MKNAAIIAGVTAVFLFMPVMGHTGMPTKNIQATPLTFKARKSIKNNTTQRGCTELKFTPQRTTPEGTVNKPYNYHIQTTGGQAPVKFTVLSGSLPKGLKLSPEGVISGTPKKPGTYKFIVKAEDSCPSGHKAVQKEFTITVKSRTPLPANIKTGEQGSSAPYNPLTHKPEITAPVGPQTKWRCNSKYATIVGTPGNDVINGTPGDDVIVGRGGNDIIHGMEGNDTICGDDGNDSSIGGNDKIYGDEGDDYINGEGGDDWINGGPGNDEIIGFAGYDKLIGGSGDDKISDFRGNNGIFVGGDGNDDFFSGGILKNLTIKGGSGDDRIFYGGENATIFGGPGNDTIRCSCGKVNAGGKKEIYGGPGDDVIVGAGKTIKINGGPGDDKIDATKGKALVISEQGHDVIKVGNTIITGTSSGFTVKSH